jgi:hypothetical protein
MTKLRGYIPTMLLLVTVLFGATAANAGIIVGDRQSAKDTNTCEETKEFSFRGFIETAAGFLKTGIIVGDRMGIIVGDRTGIIVGDRKTETCGIIVGDRNGIIVGDRKSGIIVGD